MKILSSCRVRILTPNPCLHLYKFRLWFFVNRSPRLFSCSQPRCIPLPMRWRSVFHLPALKGWKTLLFNLGQHQSTHPCHKSAAASKTQNTDVDIACVSTKQSRAKNLIPESDFSPLFKTSLRFWVTRGHLAGKWWQLLGQTPPFESSWLPSELSLQRGLSYQATYPEGSWRSFKGVHGNAEAVTSRTWN